MPSGSSNWRSGRSAVLVAGKEARPAKLTEFRDPEGLVVQIEGDNSAAAHPDYDNLTLVCTSRDPAVNPNPTPNPYDFTYPHR